MQTPTLYQALQTGIAQLQDHSPTPRLDAQWLLRATTGHDITYIMTYPQTPLTPQQADQYNAYLQRRLHAEPVAYILGEVGFYDSTLRVSPAVLIPRPETELLVEQALMWANTRPSQPLIAVDMATGSGAIAVTVARHTPHLTMHATDISDQALTIARHNAHVHQLAIHFHQGDLAQPLIQAGVRVHLLMANLPYIPSHEIPTLAVSHYEPTLALDGGADGLHLVRRLLDQIPHVCHQNALVLLEIGAGQGEATRQIIIQSGGRDVQILPDYAQHDRIARFIANPS